MYTGSHGGLSWGWIIGFLLIVVLAGLCAMGIIPLSISQVGSPAVSAQAATPNAGNPTAIPASQPAPGAVVEGHGDSPPPAQSSGGGKKTKTIQLGPGHIWLSMSNAWQAQPVQVADTFRLKRYFNTADEKRMWTSMAGTEGVEVWAIDPSSHTSNGASVHGVAKFIRDGDTSIEWEVTLPSSSIWGVSTSSADSNCALVQN